MLSTMNCRRIATLALSVLLLGGCGTAKSSCTEKTDVAELRLCIAEGWERVAEETLKEKAVPEETVAAFSSTGGGSGQRDNLVISREKLPGPVPSIAFAEANVKTLQTVPEYALTETREVKVDGEVTLLHIFTAQPAPDIPARRFYQLSLTHGAMGYTLTGTLPFSVDSTTEDTLVDMILSTEFAEEEPSE